MFYSGLVIPIKARNLLFLQKARFSAASSPVVRDVALATTLLFFFRGSDLQVGHKATTKNQQGSFARANEVLFLATSRAHLRALL
jgi:hypothetical protein